jgi:hypothetical protein
VYLEHHGYKKDITTIVLSSYKCADGYAITYGGTSAGGGYGLSVTLRSRLDEWQGMQSANLFDDQDRGGIPKKAFHRLDHAQVHTVKPDGEHL